MSTVKQLTSLDDESIDQILRWWSKQPRKIQLRCMSAEDISQLVKKAASIKKMEEQAQPDKYSRDLNDAQQAEDVRLDKIQKHRRRSSPKARKIFNQREQIKRLREKGASWLDIATYLERYNQIKVNYSYLRRQYNRLLEEGLV